MSIYCKYDSLKNESDVEQKFIFKFLSSENPRGLNFRDSDIQTKHTLKRHLIGKSKPKYYYPDYLITLRGIPLLVVEAKTPNSDLDTAFSEARLYADEVNAAFPHNLNLCNKIIVSNGTETWAGYNDQAEPVHRLLFEDFKVENKKFYELLKFCSKKELLNEVNKPFLETRGKTVFNTPVSELGGQRVQDEELVENTYGRTLIFENRAIFDPETEDDRIEIVKNAYITSAKREQHIEPMYREIKKVKLPSHVNSTLVSTESPTEIVDKLHRHINMKEVSYSLMLLIGNVGSGKTTFVRYFKEIVLSKDYNQLSKKCEWIFVNMNPAPVNKEEIYKWIKNIIVKDIKLANPTTNFNDLDIMKRLYKKDIKEFEEGIGKIIIDDTNKYNSELYKVVSKCAQDEDKTLLAILSYLKEIKRKVPIIVLDNCDKRNRDEQLLMFEVAQWIKETYKSIIILPMRDSTYDNYKNEPPLDTVVKDLVYRIDPPDLLKVLQARLEYIYRIKKNERDSYTLENGIEVILTNSEQIEYFKSILMVIRKNSWSRSIFYSLSNRNIRGGIQLFEDFCRSGHINSEDFFLIRTTDNHLIPQFKVMNALLRKNRKYFSDEKSNFINLFHSKYEDDFPDPFIRVDLLKWLKNNYTVNGPNLIQGFHKIDNIIKDLQAIGHDSIVLFREVKTLIKRGLIFSESQSSEVTHDDLIKISPSGSIHLKLLKNISYLGACSENVIYKNATIMTRISKRIAKDDYLRKVPLISNAFDMLEYLMKYKSEFLSRPEAYLKDDACLKIYDLEESNAVLDQILIEDNQLILYKFIRDNPKGTIIRCKIEKKQSDYLICSLDFNNSYIRGFASTSMKKFKLGHDTYMKLNNGDEILCKIIDYDYEHHNFQLEFIKSINEVES
ncbi:MAG: hypothetical protein GQ534_05930 [Candidatus Delongbacteria bacterium]|nr:hypothetical protein [Candidatus Delongbacteria bacterium]